MDNPAVRNTNLHVYYITHQDNLPSILQHGVLSHKKSEELGNVKKIYDANIVSSRKDRLTLEGKSLWEYANFYFNPRNPMLYRVYRCEGNDVAVIRMNKNVFSNAKYISIGNAASHVSEIKSVEQGLKILKNKNMQNYINAESWGQNEGKRFIMSELLVPDRVGAECIDTIYLPNSKKLSDVQKLIGNRSIPNIVLEPKMFFNHTHENKIPGTQITLVDGDMFFSRLQTLTISVNTLGVMGGGLAARAKYNFPHIYVTFQELCRKKKLTTKKLFLYKEEYSYDEHMADTPDTLKQKPNDEKWFLLFPTKENWRNPSRIEYIEDGFKWLLANAKIAKIKSLAMPALGCGLGGLPWHVVGPVMCKNLHELGIPCEIYLPRETTIPAEQRTANFLLQS